MSIRVYKSLEVCRASAGFLVVLFHMGAAFGSDKYFAAGDLQYWTQYGHYAVVFFFVLSGFTMVNGHYEDFNKPERLKEYLLKRVIRVYPTYLFILFGLYLVARSTASLANSVPHDFWIMLKTALLLPQDPAVVGGTGAPVIIAAWSMQYEIAFYALIACFVWRKSLGIFLIASLLINYTACKWSGNCSFPRSFLASNFIFPFFFGAVAAAIKRSSYGAQALVPALAAVFGALMVLWGVEVVFNVNIVTQQDGAVFYGLLSAALIMVLIYAEDAERIRVHRYWSYLASAGYVLYLLHYPLISALCKLAMYLDVRGTFYVYPVFVFFFLACVAAAQLFYFHIERPLVRRLLEACKSDPKALRSPIGARVLR